MEKLAIAVVDDDPAVAETIGSLIARDEPDSTVTLFRSGEELLLSPAAFDIVYLDVRLGGTDGIETARRLRQRCTDTLLIFVSGIREHVFDALDLHPFHYLLKPLDEAQFLRVLREARAAIAKRAGRTAQRLVIRTRTGSVSLPVSEIVYIERGPRRLDVHTAEGIHEMYGSLSRLEEELGNGFYRSHRAFLVNLSWVRSYRADSIVLESGEEVFLARKKYGAFVKQYMWFLEKTAGNE